METARVFLVPWRPNLGTLRVPKTTRRRLNSGEKFGLTAREKLMPRVLNLGTFGSLRGPKTTRSGSIWLGGDQAQK